MARKGVNRAGPDIRTHRPSQHGQGIETIVTPEFTNLEELRNLWQSCRDGHAAPLRSTIEARGLGRAQDHAFIVDCKTVDQARFRRAGGLVRDLMGMDVRGMKADAIFDPAFRNDCAAVLRAVVAGPATAELRLVSPGGPSVAELMARMILLPLRGNRGTIEWVLGALATDGPIGRPPRRFGIVAQDLIAISGAIPAVPRQGTYDLPEVSEPPRQVGFAEPPAAFEGRKHDQSTRQRGHLRLIVSRD